MYTNTLLSKTAVQDKGNTSARRKLGELFAMEEYAVEMQHIKKSYSGIKALTDGNIQVRKGEFHALMGENGAGKSTLMRILAGATQKDSGEIKLDGNVVEIKNAKTSIDLGVSTIYQELMLVPDLTVAENIFIDSLSKGGRLVHWKKLRQDTQKMLDEIGFEHIKATDEVGSLTVASQQIVEICKALSRNCNVLVLDEPTSVLSSKEVRNLFKMLEHLRLKGYSIIYISHRIEEVFELCDRITVMRDGGYVGTVNVSDIDKHQLVSMMIGRDLSGYFPERNVNIGDVILRVENINAGRMVKNVSFEVHAGEVLGINGLVGAGRTETLRAIFGEDRKTDGKVLIDGIEKRISSPRHSVKAGVGYLSEDRKGQGVLLELPIRFNLTLCCMKKFRGFMWALIKKRENSIIKRVVEDLNIKLASYEQDVSNLSGGNQQKVAIGKLLGADCKVLMLDEPTRGVDVGAKYEVYSIINDLAAQGYAIIMVSSEMPEIIGMCDRVLVMLNGEIKAELGKDQINEENLIQHSMGL